ncbi:hypothetical protein ULMA_19240 [Patiriisocius marinus]|uniref:CarboxypepD_reg-like domain-containing protein n=1 Tax=Patiriisocius marinus TaxID=1397112 RepID=A0A5J4IXZ0_9FLAO|nr:carboxypeptidase-like regulatory domain-containing protein [Patiriisocius marinus]GER59816.1 hypothetical protein ULMA_19240 [Patiriisocius marinus]
MKSSLVLYIILFLISYSSFSQNERLIEGDLTNEIDVEGIHILNKTSRFNAITDQNGNFKIEANAKDTLVFSAINFYPQQVVVTQENYVSQSIVVTLKYLTNELDEVVIGNQLTGDITKDLKNIKTEKNINFDDVGIPGFKGEPKEKIPDMLGEVITPVSVNIDALYKHLSGYYKNLKKMRQWQGQANAVAIILSLYPPSFFEDAYKIPENRVYDFVLMCVETSEMQQDVALSNYNGILTVFKTNAPLYLANLAEE